MATTEQELGLEKDWDTQVIEEFRANEGRVGGYFEGQPLLLLHHVGAKSGTARVTPLVYLTVGERYAVFASNGGQDNHPAWYHNLVAHPHVELQDGTVKKEYDARQVEGDERAQWWERSVAAYPPYAEYQEKTDRQIPVFVLEPREG